MDEAKLQEMMGQIAQMLQQGEDPNNILKQLIEAGIDEQTAVKMIESVMQELQGGQAQQQPQQGGSPPEAGQGGGTAGSEAMAIIQEAVQVLSANGLAMVLEAWDSLQTEQKQQVIQQLSQMAQEESSQPADAQAPQDNREQMLFGNA